MSPEARILAEFEALDRAYSEADAYDVRQYNAWVRSLKGRCAECGEPVRSEGSAMCAPCLDEWGVP